jgi:Domain of unknown function (DUF4286)
MDFLIKPMTMLLYNITYNIDKNEENDFLSWMQDVHIQEVMITGFPKSFKILKLLTEIDNGGVTYSIQYNFDSKDGFEVFENDYLDDLHDKVDKRYRGKYVHFASLLEEI